MTYKNIEDKRKYHREWARKNRDKINKKRRERRKKLKEETGFDRPAKNKCLRCGKTCINKYCSRSCYDEVNHNGSVEKWLNHEDKGINKRNNKYTPSRPVVRYMKKNYPQCQRCGWDKIHPVSGELLLQIHHKDGNHENGYLENLEHLCPNCHSLTKNYTNHG